MMVFLVIGEHPDNGSTFIFRGNGNKRVAEEMLRDLRSNLAVGFPSMTDDEFDALARRRKSLRILQVEISDEVFSRAACVYIAGLA